ncbi:hypothetical protein Tco_0853526 [Tanacetum coccineum]
MMILYDDYSKEYGLFTFFLNTLSLRYRIVKILPVSDEGSLGHFPMRKDSRSRELNRDISIVSSHKIDSHLYNDVRSEVNSSLPKSIPPKIEEVEFDPEEANSNDIESLPPSHIPVADNDSLMEEIDLFLADDGSIPPGIESDDVGLRR